MGNRIDDDATITDQSVLKVALVGNPNSGKSTLFNALTGLNQRTGNFPGVTVDKRTGTTSIQHSANQKINIEFTDLPGIYSLYPKSLDERIAFEVIFNSSDEAYPDIFVIVADATNLKRSLFLATQIIDLNRPVILALNMIDLIDKQGLEINVPLLSEKLGIRIIPVNARKKEGINELKKSIAAILPQPVAAFFDAESLSPEIIRKVKEISGIGNNYHALQVVCNLDFIDIIEPEKKAKIAALVREEGISTNKLQLQESLVRYKSIQELLDECIYVNEAKKEASFTHKLDKVITHKVAGYIIFLTILFLIFQSMFFLASFPMNWIESFFSWATVWGSEHLPPGELTNLFLNGILAGLSGVVVFVPQIALLFAFIAILEDSGYMARVSFIMDKPMQQFGLNGKSVIPLISGVACAVPAIMSARTIGNWKERMITIMVTPLMSCSARLPVYTLLISLIIPSTASDFFNMQGILLMGLYLIGFVAALGSAWLMKHVIKAKEKSYFIMELPVYRIPKWETVGLTILEKVKVFLFDAGKVIIAISIILWILSSHGPGNKQAEIEEKYSSQMTSENKTVLTSKMQSERLEASYAGILGKTIEPYIAPLGFDWKIGISLITSFAAREVFVGTMATIYSIGDEDNTQSIRQKMMNEKNMQTGEKVYSFAVGFSLILFFAFAMQCMSTLAVVFRETKSWKWPMIQFLYMGCLAYLSSFIVYQLLK